MKKEKSILIRRMTIRIEPDLLKKLHYISKYEGRSANAQILYLIRQCVATFEKEHNEIIDTK